MINKSEFFKCLPYIICIRREVYLKIKKIIVAICIFIFLCGCTSESDIDTDTGTKQILDTQTVCDGFNRIAVTFYGNTETQIGLSWYTPYKDNYGNDVEIIEKDTLEKQDISYEVQYGYGEYDEESMYHQTVIKGLTPDTEYYFRVGDKKSQEWSEYGSFKTGSRDIKEFLFVAVTDTQSEHLPDAYFSSATMKTAVSTAETPAFIMHSGDFVDDGGDESLWSAQMNSARDILMNNIIVPAVGNHDADNNSFWQHFMLEKTNGHKTTGIYYSYDYGNVHFAVLDTNKTNDDDTSYIDDEQLKWLDEDLGKARENGAKWIIVNTHRGSYTVGEHASSDRYAGDDGMRLRLGGILEKHGVELVIQGHDHCPSVTKPIAEGKASENGVIYINTGAAGSKSYEMGNNMTDEYYDMFQYIDVEEREKGIYQNFAVVEVKESKIKVTMYELDITKTENQLYILYEFDINRGD